MQTDHLGYLRVIIKLLGSKLLLELLVFCDKLSVRFLEMAELMCRAAKKFAARTHNILLGSKKEGKSVKLRSGKGVVKVTQIFCFVNLCRVSIAQEDLGCST